MTPYHSAMRDKGHLEASAGNNPAATWGLTVFPRHSGTSAQEPTSHSGGGSGGYLEHVFRHAAQELFGIHVDEVTYRPLRSVGKAPGGSIVSPGSPCCCGHGGRQ